jgi:hypothetical protein
MFTATAVVTAPVDRVTELLLSAHPGPVGPNNGWLLHRSGYPAGPATLGGGPCRFEVVADDVRTLFLDIDRDSKTAALQGGWWYRGEYEVAAEAADLTRLTYRVRNVATRPTWLVALSHRLFIGYRGKMRRALIALCADIERDLGVGVAQSPRGHHWE